jgi:hypothetical protein
MSALETSRGVTPREQPTSFAALNAVRTALEQTPGELAAPRSQQAVSEKPSDTAVALRLASEAIATATKAAETELRKVRDRLEECERRARRAEERASLSEQRVANLEKVLCKIRDDIIGQIPSQQLAA